MKSADVKLVEKIAKGVTFLIKDGVELQSWEPAFHYTKLDDLKIEMLGGAAADAKERAQEIGVEERGQDRPALFCIARRFSDHSGVLIRNLRRGWLDTSSIEKTIRAVVTVSYEVH